MTTNPTTPPEPQAGATPDLAAIQGVTGMPAKIITSHIYPPIPIRAYDWVAYFDGQEEGLHGEGPTEEAAIKDLREQVECNQGETQCGTCLDELHFGRRISEMVHKAETKCMECGMMLCGEHARLHFKANGKPLPCENLQVANEAIEMLTEHTATLETALATSRAETEAARAKLRQITPLKNIDIRLVIGLSQKVATLTATLAQREAEADTLRVLAEERRKEIAAHGSHGWIEIQKTCGRQAERIKELEEDEAIVDFLATYWNSQGKGHHLAGHWFPNVNGSFRSAIHSEKESIAAARAAGTGEEGAGV